MPIMRPTVQNCFIPQNYTSSPEVIKNCLQEVLEQRILKPQAGEPDNEDMTKKKREQIIKAHMEKYTTKYYESDRRWHSFLPDETLPRKQKPIAKRRWEDLENAIVAFYESNEQTQQRKFLTLRNLYPECEPENYIFIQNGKRLSVHSVDWFYEKYCRDLNIIKKGNHKTRKTCLTKIGDNPNINLKDAMEFAGHKDAKTFINHYCFSRYSDEQKRIELEKTLNN